MQTLFTVNDLAERWNIDRQSIRKMEMDGKLHRLPDMPGVRFSAAEVIQLESIGKDAQALTAWERRQLVEENTNLREQVRDLTERLLRAQQVLQGGT